MNRLLRLLQTLEPLNRALFRLASVACVLMALLAAAIVLARYGFSLGSIAAQELVMYLHAFVLLGAAATTLALDEHVRVDIFYRDMTPKRQALVDLCGHLLLALPVMLFILLISWDYVAQAFVRREASAEPGGLPWVYLWKAMMLMFALQMLLQSLLQLLRAWQRWHQDAAA